MPTRRTPAPARRTPRRTARTTARKATGPKGALAAKQAHLPRGDDHAHGYLTAQLKEAPKDKKGVDAVLASIKADLDTQNATFPAKAKKYGFPSEKPPRLEISLMEDTAKHKGSSRSPGKQVIVFVSFNPVPPGHEVAHGHIEDLGETCNSNSHVAEGLGNHWCCYSDA